MITAGRAGRSWGPDRRLLAHLSKWREYQYHTRIYVKQDALQALVAGDMSGLVTSASSDAILFHTRAPRSNSGSSMTYVIFDLRRQAIKKSSRNLESLVTASD